MEVNYTSMNDILIEKFPELDKTYKEELDWWGDEKPGPHIIYGDIFCPYIISLLEAKNQEEKLYQVFDFLEILARNEDLNVRSVVAVTVCDNLVEKDKSKQAKKYMGSVTRSFYEEAERLLRSH